ncbi:hypothetical protein [Novosphingobium sp.]|uniref:hypothetical protein n=1 Tax=Novosphingobium sp. TaxID=1874826 RepID=UPI003D1295EA
MIFKFFATREETYEIWDVIAERPGVRLVEADSRPGKENREFDKFPLTEWQSQDRNFSVVAWASKAGGKPSLRKTIFGAATANALGAPGRSSLTSPAFFKIHRVSAPDVDLIAPSELVYWTEKLAAKSQKFSADQIQETDWNELGREVTAIKRWITSQSVAMWRGAPVSKKVADSLSAGKAQLWLWGATGRI